MFRLPRRGGRISHAAPGSVVMQLHPGMTPADVARDVADRLRAAAPAAVDRWVPPPSVDPGALRILDRLERQVARIAARQAWPSLDVGREAPGLWIWTVTSPRGEQLDARFTDTFDAALERGLEALAAHTVQHALAAGATLPAELEA